MVLQIIFHNKDDFSGSADPSQPLCPLLPLPHQTCTLSGLSRKTLLWHKQRFTLGKTKTYFGTKKDLLKHKQKYTIVQQKSTLVKTKNYSSTKQNHTLAQQQKIPQHNKNIQATIYSSTN